MVELRMLNKWKYARKTMLEVCQKDKVERIKGALCSFIYSNATTGQFKIGLVSKFECCVSVTSRPVLH